jgi:TolB protein
MNVHLQKMAIGLGLMALTLWLGGGVSLAGSADNLYVTLSGELYQADSNHKVQPFNKEKVESTTGKITRVLDLSRNGDLLVGIGERQVIPNTEHIGGNDLFVTDVDGSYSKQITSNLNVFQARWSPAGDKFAYVTRKMQLYLATPDGSVNKLISPVAVEPSWSGDGSKLVYSHFDEPYKGAIGYTVGIAVYDVASDRETVYTSGYDDSNPIFSPDKKRVLFFSSLRTSVASEYILNLEDRKVEQITNVGMTNAYTEKGFVPVHLSALWSSDGNTIVFHTRYAEKEIWSLKLSGNKVVKSSKLGNGESPSWVVDGRRVKFVDTSEDTLKEKTAYVD